MGLELSATVAPHQSRFVCVRTRMATWLSVYKLHSLTWKVTCPVTENITFLMLLNHVCNQALRLAWPRACLCALLHSNRCVIENLITFDMGHLRRLVSHFHQ